RDELGVGLVDVDSLVDALPALRAELLGASDEMEVRLARGRREVSRLVRATRALPAEPTAIGGERSYLVAGGMRGIGLPCAEQLVLLGVKKLVLFGRQAAGQEAAEWIGRWRRDGLQVSCVLGDVGNEADVERAVSTARTL